MWLRPRVSRAALALGVILTTVGLGCIGEPCQPGDCPAGGTCIRICIPIVCTGNASICPPQTFCWPDPSEDDGSGSVCTEPRLCDGGSILDSPACSEGDCGLDGLVCRLSGGVGPGGADTLFCACSPP